MKYRKSEVEVICSGSLGVNALCILKETRRELDPAPKILATKQTSQVQFCVPDKLFSRRRTKQSRDKVI